MSLSGASNFVAGDEDLRLHQLFDFANACGESVEIITPPADGLHGPPRLGSPFAGPLENLHGQPVGWFSPPAAGPVDVLDAVNFDDFLVLDEGIDDLPAAAEEAPSPPPPPPPEVTDTSTSQEEPGSLLASATLEAAQTEIAQLKAVLAAGGPQLQTLTTPGGFQSSSSPRKRKSTDGEVSPPKRQITTHVGPIETLWLQKVTEGESRSAFVNASASPQTPLPSQSHLDLSATTPNDYISSPPEFDISPEDIHSIQTFLRDNPALVQGTSHRVDTTISTFDISMPHPVNMKAKRTPPEHAPKPPRKASVSAASKIVKKTKTAPRKTQHQRAASTTPTVALSPSPPTHHRSIDELLAANFYSLNEQEKLRLVLPMLRNLDPRALEASLAAMSSIQAKGPGHKVRVARAIHDSSPTPEADDVLATKLTYGTARSFAPVTKTSVPHFSNPTSPASQDLPWSHKISQVEISEDIGAARQREALDKAALLQAQGEKR